MKTKLLKRLRSEYRIVHFPETRHTREYWEIQRHVERESEYLCFRCEHTLFSYEEALQKYHNIVHRLMSNDIAKRRSKVVFP